MISITLNIPHQSSMTKLGGLWRNLLIVRSEQPIEWYPPPEDPENPSPLEPIEITFPIDDDVSVIYYTEGLYADLMDGDAHCYHFIYNQSRTMVGGESAELVSLRSANDSMQQEIGALIGVLSREAARTAVASDLGILGVPEDIGQDILMKLDAAVQ